MNAFQNVLHTYVANYEHYREGKVPFECETGELIFVKTKKKQLILFSIYIVPTFRRQGICRQLLQSMVDICVNTKKFDSILVESVLSNILYNYLLRFRYKNYVFQKQNDGFYCKIKHTFNYPTFSSIKY